MKLSSIVYLDAAGRVPLDLSTAPHVLIAGTTGSGKSACVRLLFTRLLQQRPDATFCVIDPKKIDYIAFRPACEVYGDDFTGAWYALQYATAIMNRRYEIMQEQGLRAWSPLFLIWDELAALLDTEAKKHLLPVLNNLLRLGRAAGVHCILATQNPLSSDGIISSQTKANCPTRIAFRVAQAVNSRVIIDRNGAEQLRGRGDGILLRSDGTLERFQGAMVSENEVTSAVSWYCSMHDVRPKSIPKPDEPKPRKKRKWYDTPDDLPLLDALIIADLWRKI